MSRVQNTVNRCAYNRKDIQANISYPAEHNRYMYCTNFELAVLTLRKVTGFGPKVGQISPKWAKSKTFSEEISVHSGESKCTEIKSEKVSDLSQSDPLLAHSGHPEMKSGFVCLITTWLSDRPNTDQVDTKWDILSKKMYSKLIVKASLLLQLMLMPILNWGPNWNPCVLR